MYIVTFYSFKGGVGRTMALVNVAVELVRSGRRVLLVDFDLEAPGMETFTLIKPPDSALGLVDYVNDYLAAGTSPDLGPYIHKTENFEGNNGHLWIMPAGRQDSSYGPKFTSLDWHHLYSQHNGYLMFENLKGQWQQELQPDYVLVDSRTGHTDVGGICTRQLPDAVVMFFFPNEQNLSGLQKVVSDVRGESDAEQKTIQLHFVNSNVPDLDDEDQILASRIERFQKLLGYEELTATIHHYNSLALLNQVIFSVERPRSRLAQEYRALTKAIVRENLADREAALELLSGEMPLKWVVRREMTTKDTESRLDRIRDLHASDGEILYRLGVARERQGKSEEALALFTEAIEQGEGRADVFLRRAEVLHGFLGDKQASLADVKRSLDSSSASYVDVNRAIRLLRKLNPEALSMIPKSAALRSLEFDERAYGVVQELTWLRSSLSVAEIILRDLLEAPEKGRIARPDLVSDLELVLIGQGKFKESMELIEKECGDISSWAVHHTFNFSMAMWGETDQPPHEYFRRVIADTSRNPDPNYNQCLALIYAVLGDMRKSVEMIEAARERMAEQERPSFSVWRYLRVSPPQFFHDLELMLKGIREGQLRPTFFEEVRQQSLFQ